MTAFVKFQSFSKAMAEKKHDLTNDQLEIALCDAANAPDLANDAVLADLTVINYANLSTRSLTTSSGTSAIPWFSAWWPWVRAPCNTNGSSMAIPLREPMRRS